MTVMKQLFGAMLSFAVASVAQAGMLFDGDGSDEPGFVAPQMGAKPPPPPAQISSAESYIPFPGPPVVPMARSEKKNPPKPPVMFTKLKSDLGPLDWATRPNDLNNLLKSMKAMMDVDLACEVKSLAEIDADPEKNPILYRSGHFHFSFSPAERARLREYLLGGGMLILNAGMGSKPFYDSAIAEMKSIFPEVPVARLSPDHAIFHSYYDLDRVEYRTGVREAGYQGNEPWLEGITINCRVVAVISRWGMDIGWDATDDDSMRGYSIDSARKLGINLMAYATAERAWAKQLAQALKFIDKPEGSSAGQVAITQVMYNGEWKTRHKGFSILLQQFNQKTDVPVKFAMTERRLTDPAIYDSPLLYLTGHEDFSLNDAEVSALRRYLENGGLLLAEACCGRAAFDRALRKALSRALPGKELERIPQTDSIFTLPNQLDRLGITPALGAIHASATTLEPRLESITVDGHYSVIYSPYGMAGGWEMAQNPYALGYDDSSSIRLGENILMHAVVR